MTGWLFIDLGAEITDLRATLTGIEPERGQQDETSSTGTNAHVGDDRADSGIGTGRGGSIMERRGRSIPLQ
jgi:hypothetical protein